MQPLAPSLIERLRADPAYARKLKLDVERERCRRSFVLFVQAAWPHIDSSSYIHGWYIEAICRNLEAVARGEIRKLLINIPPRHGKSIIISVLFPLWLWIQEKEEGNPLCGPGCRILATSYIARLSTRDNVKRRRLLRSKWFQDRWGDYVAVSEDNDTKTAFSLTGGGFSVSTSVKGFSTGEGGDIILIDDPISVVEARSEVKRQERIDWLTETMPTRLNDQKTGAVVMVMQRVHERDPAGYILGKGLDWVHLCLPGWFEPDHPYVYPGDPRRKAGELLFPERFGIEEMTDLTSGMTDYAIAGQIQQRPAPRSGGMFKREWIKVIDAVPAGTIWVRGWDLASTEKTVTTGNPDYTAGVLLGKTPSGHLIVANAIRFQEDEAGVADGICAIASQDGRGVKIRLPQDPGAAGKSWGRYLVKRLIGYAAVAKPVVGKKTVRAEPVAAQARVGNLFLLKERDGEHWHEPFVEELCTFPNGQHDHWVDALSDAFDELVVNRKSAKTFAGAF